MLPKFGKKYFSGNYHVKFGHFVNFSYIYFLEKYPPKLTELLYTPIAVDVFNSMPIRLSVRLPILYLVPHGQHASRHRPLYKCLGLRSRPVSAGARNVHVCSILMVLADISQTASAVLPIQRSRFQWMTLLCFPRTFFCTSLSISLRLVPSIPVCVYVCWAYHSAVCHRSGMFVMIMIRACQRAWQRDVCKTAKWLKCYIRVKLLICPTVT